MARPLSLLVAVASTLVGSAAIAQEADDGFAWINNCKKLTMAKGADDETAHGYCACIDHEMGDEEINDVPGWEKANPPKVAACKAAADWK